MRPATQNSVHPRPACHRKKGPSRRTNDAPQIGREDKEWGLRPERDLSLQDKKYVESIDDPIHIKLTKSVTAPPEKIFNLLSDFSSQDQWLPKGLVYRGTEKISDDPITVGTTYFEWSLMGHRDGKVLTLDRPTLLEFDQPFTMRFGLGTVAVHLRVELEPAGDATQVTRNVTIRLPRRLRPFKRMLIPRFVGEGQRVMSALERHYANRQI